MGDVCGKGTEAAKVTALARYTLRAEATQQLSPATVLTHLNSALLDQRVGGGRFLTAVYATFRLTAAWPRRTPVHGRASARSHPPRRRTHPVGRLTGNTPGHPARGPSHRRPFPPRSGRHSAALHRRRHRGPSTRRHPRREAPLFDEADLATALAATHGADATETVRHLGQVLADHTGGWASDDTALLALRVPPTG